MTTEERVLRLENAFATLSELAVNTQGNASKLSARTADLEKHFNMLSQLAVRADERMDGHDAGLSNLTAKLEALADAQIRTEETLNRLGERVDKLAETVERYISEGRNGST
jgi:prefoldin subunit 5